MALNNITLEGNGNSRAGRLRSVNPQDFPVPAGNEEEWRFTPVEKIADFFDENRSAQPVLLEVRGAEVENISGADADVPWVAEDKAGALAYQLSERHRVVLDSPEHEEIFIDTCADEGMNVACLSIHAKQNARASVVISHTGVADLNECLDVYAENGAEITIVSIQEAETSARHLSAQHVTLEKDAHVRHIAVTLGGDIIRLNTSVDFAEPGGEVELLGAYITGADQHHEHRLFVNHDKENCTSKVTYKGALQGENAHGVWVGDVLIGAEATNTDTYELNRNLVLGRGPRVDSVPNLEIETGKILGAGHASATGRFDEEQLFYLQARGIDEDTARRLVVRGFFADLIDTIAIDSVRERLMSAVDNELNLAPALDMSVDQSTASTHNDTKEAHV